MTRTLKSTPIFASETSLFKTVSAKNVNVNVLFGKDERLLVNEIVKSLPFSKILFLQTTNVFLSSGLRIIERLKSEGIKVINFLIDEMDLLSLDSVCGVFCASEEVRGVVALGERAFDFAKYYASVSGAKFFAVAHTFLPFDFFKSKLYIKNGSVIDSVSVPIEQTLIVDENSFLSSELILFIGSFLAKGCFSLIDAKLYGGLLDEDYAELKKDFSRLVDVSFLSSADNFSQDAEKLLRRFIDYAENFYNKLNKEAFNSCLSAASFLYHGGFRTDHAFVVRAALKIFSIIENLRESPIPLEPCDFRQRVDKVKTLASLEENALLESLVLQERRLYGKRIEDFFSENVGLWKIKKILGGVKEISVYDEQKFNLAIKHSGDTTLNVNTASLLRHIGALEKV